MPVQAEAKLLRAEALNAPATMAGAGAMENVLGRPGTLMRQFES